MLKEGRMPIFPHGKDLRKGRFSEINRIYHITTITVDRYPWFSDFDCGRIVVKKLKHEEVRADTLAFVLMPDHLHWLMQLKESADLGRVVGNIKSWSSLELNRHLGREGSIWQSGFHDHALRKEEDIEDAARYIVANPLWSGIVQEIGQYSLWDAVWLR